jgi:hypothetical protein
LDHREAKDLPKIQRGQLDWNKLLHCMVYARELGWHDVADGLLVIYSACTRQQDIKTATVDNLEGLDTKTPTFWTLRKADGAGITQKGKYTPDPIAVRQAVDILIARVKRSEETGEPLLFPHWNAQHATIVVKHVAERDGWSQHVNWTGSHNARHGRARDTFDVAMESVLDAGRWESISAASTRFLAMPPAAQRSTAPRGHGRRLRSAGPRA